MPKTPTIPCLSSWRGALLGALCVVVVACAAPRVREEPPAAEPPVAAATWERAGSELRQLADSAGQAAYEYAHEAMGRWFRRVSSLTDSKFVPWATDYWTHQWLSLKLAWYHSGDGAGNGDAAALARLTGYLEDEYRSQVLEPAAEEIDPLQVMDEASGLYAGALVSGIRELQQRHALPPRQFAAWLAAIPLIASPPGATLQDLTDAANVAALPAYQGLTARLRRSNDDAGFRETALRPVVERVAEHLSTTLATRGGATAASLLGGVPGVLLGLGVSAWDATAYEGERPTLEAALRSDLDGALRSALWRLLHDRDAGVLAPIAHMAAHLDRALPAPAAPESIELGPVQGLF